MYKEQLEKLHATNWTNKAGSGKHIQIFLCGDDEFLTTMFDITDANDVHPCLFRHIARTSIQKVTSVFVLKKFDGHDCDRRMYYKYSQSYFQQHFHFSFYSLSLFSPCQA